MRSHWQSTYKEAHILVFIQHGHGSNIFAPPFFCDEKLFMSLSRGDTWNNDLIFWQNQDHCVARKLNECFPRWHTLMCIRFTTARYKGISANFRLWLRRKAMRRSRLSFIRHRYTWHNSSWSDLGFQHMVCTDIYSAVWVGFTAHLTDLNPNSNLCCRIHWKTPKVHNMCIIIDNCFCSYSSPLSPSSPLAHNRKQPWDFGPRPLPFSVCGAYWSVLSMPWPSSQQWPQRRSHLVKSP